MNRNIFFVALIVLVSLTTLALSGPQIVHNNKIFLAATSNSSNSSTAPTCTSNVTCAGKGDACTSNYDGTSNSSSTACAQGLWCINSTCVTDNIGDKCTSASQCYLPSTAGAISAQCSAGVCAYAYQLGDGCTNNTDCQSGLFCNTNTSLCDGLTLGTACNFTDGPWCGYGLICYPKQNGNFVCQNEVAVGNSCKNMPFCAPWTFCNSNNTCQAFNSVPAGGQCDSDLECVSGYNCILSNCTQVTDSLTSCTANSDCTGDGSFCYCSEYSGKQFCVGLNYNVDPCNEYTATLISCLAENNCSEGTNAPESCSYKNCASQYKKSYSCGCSATKTIGSSCVYNAYCGGFPIWAIIIIIVVAIVLVLGIVLLVFFMMRRRRQYESI